MTPNDTFDRALSDWLRADSEHRVPDHLDDVLRQTVSRRQRPAWSNVGRWVPDVVAGRASVLPLRTVARLTALAIVAFLVLTLIALVVGSRRSLPPPFGLARNGIVVAGIDGDLFRIDPASGARTPLVSDAPEAFDFSPIFSRDGTRIVFLRVVIGKGIELVVADPDGSNAKVVGPAVDGLDQYDWSPDGSRIVFLSRDNGRGQINVVNTDGSGVTTTLKLPFAVNQVSWLPPDGTMILFRREHMFGIDPPPGIFAIRPDGTDLIEISTRPAVDDDDYQDVSASPDGVYIGYRDSGVIGSADRVEAHILNRTTGRDVVLKEPPGSLGQTSPAFSPDGMHVMFLRFKTPTTFDLVVAPLDGSSIGTTLALNSVLPQTSELSKNGPSLNNTFFAPDGRSVIGNDLTTNTEWLLPIDGSPGTVLARGSQETDGLSTVQRLAP